MWSELVLDRVGKKHVRRVGRFHYKTMLSGKILCNLWMRTDFKGFLQHVTVGHKPLSDWHKFSSKRNIKRIDETSYVQERKKLHNSPKNRTFCWHKNSNGWTMRIPVLKKIFAKSYESAITVGTLIAIAIVFKMMINNASALHDVLYILSLLFSFI